MKISLFLLALIAQFTLHAQFAFDNGTLSLKQNEQNKYGFTDIEGNWIIAATYDDARELPTVNAAIVLVDSKFRFIDVKGNFKNDWKLDEVYLTSGTEKILCYAKVNGKWGALDVKFKEVMPFQYEIEPYNELHTFYVDGGYSYLTADDLIACKKEGKYGVINSANEIKVPFEYEQIRLQRNMSSKAELMALKKNGKWTITSIADFKNAAFIYDDYLETRTESLRVVQLKGQWIFLNIFEESGKQEYSESDNSIIDVWKEGKWGKINGKGEQQVPFVSDYVMNHAQIYSKYDFKPNLNHDFTVHYGILNAQGMVVLDPDLEEVYPEDDMFIVQRDGAKGLITNSGTWVFAPFFEDLKHVCLDLYATKNAGKWKVYNNYGANVYPSGVDEVICSEEILLIRKQDKWGAISKTGKKLTEAMYQSLGDGFKNGLCIAKFEDKYGVINRNGETVIFYDYEEVDPNFNYYRSSKTEKFKLNGKWVDVQLP